MDINTQNRLVSLIEKALAKKLKNPTGKTKFSKYYDSEINMGNRIKDAISKREYHSADLILKDLDFVQEKRSFVTLPKSLESAVPENPSSKFEIMYEQSKIKFFEILLCICVAKKDNDLDLKEIYFLRNLIEEAQIPEKNKIRLTFILDFVDGEELDEMIKDYGIDKETVQKYGLSFTILDSVAQVIIADEKVTKEERDYFAKIAESFDVDKSLLKTYYSEIFNK